MPTLARAVETLRDALLVAPSWGTFYSHGFVNSGFPDQDAVWGGLGLVGIGPVSINVGVAYERYPSCPADCDTWWPEATAGFSS